MNKKKMSPYIIIILSFLITILIGTALLMLPFSTHEDTRTSVIDALFNATSAVCITGLVSVTSLASVYTVFGKIVIIALVEIGGLGFLTIAMFLVSVIGSKIGISERFLIKESLNQIKMQGMVKLVRSTVIITLICQLIGALINFIVFSADYPFWTALGYGFFHSIAAFNNAGFDIIGSNSFVGYSDNILLNLNISALVIIGGIGFIVIYDILHVKKYKKYSVHTKIVLKTTLFLLISGTILLKLIEGPSITWLEAFFNSTTARTAGFRTIDFSLLSNAGITILSLLMFIGASPSSTGGGIKTTTFYTIIKSVSAFARGKDAITHNKKISDNSIFKAFMLTVVAFAFIVFMLLVISIVENYNPKVINDSLYLRSLGFELISAFATVGNSTGITPTLHPISKFLISITMFVGRLGPITFISVWNKHWYQDKSKNNIKYIEEKIIIG